MTTHWYNPISLAAYDVLWEERFGPQEKPHVLDCESPGETEAAREQVRARAHAELDHTGAPPVQLLEALAQPDEAYSLRWTADSPARTLAARRRNVHALATIGVQRWPNTIFFGWSDEGGLPAALVSLLPAGQPARLRPQSVRLHSVAKVSGEVSARRVAARHQPVTFLSDEFRSCGETPDASAAFARLGAGRSSGRGELTVSVGYGPGRRATGHKVMLNDVEGKRYLVVTKNDYVTMRGASDRDVIDELYRELADLGCPVYRR
jgi:hypothetical protein